MLTISQSPLPATMTAIAITAFGDPDVLRPETRPVPTPAKGEVLVKVAAAGVNRPDLLQRRGHYAPPPGVTDIPGLDIAGTIAAIGPDTQSPYPVGASVCALLAGGGYAEYAVVPVGQLLPVPHNMTMDEAACLPESVFTVWQNIFVIGQFQPGQSALVHGGASGIGTTAIQMLRYKKAHLIFVTAGSDEKCAYCTMLGATHATNYKTNDFAQDILEQTNNHGVDLVLDMVGGNYVPRNLACLKPQGRHITIAMLNGMNATINLRDILTKSLVLTGSTLRPRTLDEKRILRDDILNQIWPGVERGDIRPIIHARFHFHDAHKAHEALERSDHIGKIVLTMPE